MCASMRRIKLNEHITAQSERKKALTDTNKVLQVSGPSSDARRVGRWNPTVNHNPVNNSSYPTSCRPISGETQVVPAPKESISSSLWSQ
jgi:hypothetical protein